MPSINLSSGVLDKPHLIVLLTRQMPNKVIVTRLLHLDAFCKWCQNGGKRWKFIRWRQSSKQNEKVHILLNVLLAIHFRFMSSLNLLINLQVFWPWSLLGLRGLQEGLFLSEVHIKWTPCIILSDRMAHFVWRPCSHFYCKASLYSGNTNYGHVGIPKLQVSL